MPKAETDDKGLQKHTLHLFKGDYERAASLYENISGAEVIRKAVRNFLDQAFKETKTAKLRNVETNL